MLSFSNAMGSMVLLNHVVEISACAHFHLPPTVIFVSKQSQTSKGCFVPIDVDLGRPWDPSMGDNCTEKCLCRLHIAIIAEQRPYCRTQRMIVVWATMTSRSAIIAARSR